MTKAGRDTVELVSEPNSTTVAQAGQFVRQGIAPGFCFPEQGDRLTKIAGCAGEESIEVALQRVSLVDARLFGSTSGGRFTHGQPDPRRTMRVYRGLPRGILRHRFLSVVGSMNRHLDSNP